MRTAVREKVKQKAVPASRVLALVPIALKAAYEDNCLGFAKGVAYSLLLSFFPVLASIAIILARTRADWMARTVSRFLSQALPPGADAAAMRFFTAVGSQPLLIPIITALLVSVWAASGAIVTFMQGFRVAYHIPAGRSLVWERVVSMLLVISAAIPLIGASVFLMLGSNAERALVTWAGLLPAGAELTGWISFGAKLARYLITLGSAAAGALFLYYFGPNRRQRLRFVWPGAVLASITWFGATLIFGWYVRNLGNYNLMYGSFAAAILLLVWMYVLAVIAFIGCELNVAWEKQAR